MTPTECMIRPLEYCWLRHLRAAARYEKQYNFAPHRAVAYHENEELLLSDRNVFSGSFGCLCSLFSTRRVKQWRTDIARRLVFGAVGDSYTGIPLITDPGQKSC